MIADSWVYDLLSVVAAWGTSLLSGVVGMGGGLTLIAIMLMYMDYWIVLPVHGVVQLASNSSRSLFLFRSIHWRYVAEYCVGLIPFGALGLLMIGKTNVVYIKVFIGGFILFVVYFPFGRFAWRHPQREFVLAGGLCGFFSMIAGGAGPLLAPFFLEKPLSRESVVSTQAACQLVTHLMKIVAFGVIWQFPFQEYGTLIIGMILAVILGTYMGKRILVRNLSEQRFRLIYKIVLTLLALKFLCWDGLRPLLQPYF
ncbi:MAG: sulfite exporter TauE/SafE family protein [SAR324 cluster bacterium]|nr:sulfite exporter TauE/SafE family protein [SAR324 cluster bacterium]